MPQVPYTGVPTVAPSERGLEVSPSPEAFGVGVAQAVEKMGGSIEKAGDEIWQRGVALQQLRNETEAKDADIQFMIEVGEKHSKFNALEGKDRVDALQGYSRDLQDTYRRYRAGLSNDMARRMFDSTAVGTMQRSIFNGAGAAATAQKEWSRSTDAATLKNNNNQTFDNPVDNTEFNNRVSKVRPIARNMAATSIGGWSQEKEDEIAKEAESDLWLHRVKGIARANALAAADMMDENRSKFTDLDWEKAEKDVRAAARTTGADNLALNKLNQYRTPTGYSKTYEEMENELRTETDKVWGKRDSLMPKFAVDQLEHHWSQDKRAKMLDDQQLRRDIDNEIIRGVKTMSQFSPDLVRRMSDNPALKLQAQGWINHYINSQNEAGSKAEELRLRGLYSSPDTRAQFMDENLMANKLLNRPQINFFSKLQREQTDDPRVKRALGWLQGGRAKELQALGLFSRDKANPDDFDRFTGAIHEAIQAYQDTYGKPPGEKEVLEQIFPSVTRAKVEQDRSVFHPLTTERPVYQAVVPEKARAAIDRDRAEQKMPPATEDDYIRDFERTQFIHYFEERPKPKTQGRMKQ